MPESLEPLLVAQIDRLTPPDRQVLRAAAVLGTRFNPVVLQDLLDTDAGVDEAVWARLSGFVVPAGSGWQFTHGLIRDAAYEGLSFRRRKELHARAARAIEARTTAPGDTAALLSLHWLHAEHTRRPGATPAWRETGPESSGPTRTAPRFTPGRWKLRPASPCLRPRYRRWLSR